MLELAFAGAGDCRAYDKRFDNATRGLGSFNMVLRQSIKKICLIAWASPYSAAGVLIGMIGILTGGKGRMRAGALEFYGGGTAWLVRHLPTGPYTLGMTLGHVIIGQTAHGLDVCSLHERVHVQQFERWGPFMGPAYLLASGWQWMRGRDAYRDNPFEVQAYRDAP